MNQDPAALVYYVLAVVPTGMLLATLLPLLDRRGTWVQTSPTRDQWLLLGMFFFATVFAGIVQGRFAFALFMALCTLVILTQSTGPKRWFEGRLYGVQVVGLGLQSWTREGETLTLKLTMGMKVAVVDGEKNRPFVEAVAGPTEGDPA